MGKTAKFFILACVCMLFSAEAYSQWYLGGSLRGVKTNPGVKEPPRKQYLIAPEAGYTFGRWGIGFAPEFACVVDFHSYHGEEIVTKDWDVGLRMYARYTLIARNAVSVFLDGEGYLSYWGSPYIGIKPGIAYRMSDHCMATMHLGILGYSEDMLGFDLSGNSLGLSLFYLFGSKRADADK